MRKGLGLRILIGLVVGFALGVAAHLWLEPKLLTPLLTYLIEPAGKVFLRLLFMLILPLVVSALALGVAGLGDLRQLGRVGLKTLVYTVVVSAIAVLIGIGMVNLVRPGERLDEESRARLQAEVKPPTPPGSTPSATTAGATAAPATPSAPGARKGVDFVIGLVPSNVVQAMAENDLLAVMTFATFLGIGLMLVRTEAARQLERTLAGLNDVVMRLLEIVLRAAPIGVACLVFTLAARLGLDLFAPLLGYVLVVVVALALQLFVVYPLILAWLGGMKPLFFFRAVKTAMVTAFSTASSNATLPTSLLVAERELKLPAHVSRFVLTVGATANQNGTALFEGVTVLFLAQFYGVQLDFLAQLTVVFICILGGIGTAGVPAGSLPVVALILGQVGVPVEGIGIILGVDRFLDMCRTTLNVTGDLAAAVVISRGEPAAESPRGPGLPEGCAG